jgi:SAM-dependent methyltransferase
VYSVSEKHQEFEPKIRINMPDWNTLFTSKENRWDNIHEEVLALAESRKLPKSTTILDLGCGAGRHMEYLGKRYYHMVGLDIAPNGLAVTRERLAKKRLPVELALADMSAPLPFADESFDCVVSIHVIFHNPRKVIAATIAEMNRVTKPGGLILTTFNSTLSSRCGKGIELEEGTWIPDTGIDEGIPHHFSTLQDVVDLMVPFEVTSIQLDEKITNLSVSAHWNVWARKPVQGR